MNKYRKDINNGKDVMQHKLCISTLSRNLTKLTAASLGTDTVAPDLSHSGSGSELERRWI